MKPSSNQQVSDMDIGEFSIDSINEFLKMETTMGDSNPLFNRKPMIKKIEDEVEEYDYEDYDNDDMNRLEFQRKKRRRNAPQEQE